MALSGNKNSNFSNALGFLEEDIEIKSLLKGGAKNIFRGLTLGILENRSQKKRRGKKINKLSKTFEKNIERNNGEVIKAVKVTNQIEKVVSDIKDILNKHQDLTEQGISKISDVIRLKALIFWVLKLLESSGYKVASKKNKLVDVPSEYSRVFYDVLKDKALSTLLVVLQSYGLADESENPINGHEIEEEVKILNINRKEVIRKLEEMGAQQEFEGDIHDEYYDYPEPHETLEKKGGIKSTFRTRKKTDKKGNIRYFYTIKRKLTEEEERTYVDSGILEEQTGTKTKRAFEKEFEIKNIELFKTVIKGYGLVKTREKKKKRVSYSLENGDVKFDFDNYKGKQSMMEIEASKYKYIDKYIGRLGLVNHQTSISGSQVFLNSKETDI